MASLVVAIGNTGAGLHGQTMCVDCHKDQIEAFGPVLLPFLNRVHQQGKKERNVEKPCLNDRAEYPSDEVLSRHLGEVKQTWDSFVGMIKSDYPSFTGEWRYYNDGKSWLYKVTRKKQTMCWVSVCDHLFKTTFYFPDRAEDAIVASKLKKEYVDQFTQGRRYGKIRGVTVSIKRPTDLSATRTLIEIKERVK